MSFNQFITILLARKFIIIFTIFIALASGIAISKLMPKQYEATTSIIFNTKGVDPISGYSISASMLPGYIATQVTVLNSQRVALKVVDKLGLQTNPAFIEAYTKATEGQGSIRLWIADNLLDDLTISPSREASIAAIRFTSTSPEFSALVSNTFAEEYINTNIELKVEPAKKTAEWFDGQVKKLKTDVEKAQQKLTQYEKEKGILFSDSRYDVETTRLNQLTTAQLQSEEQLFDLKAKLNAVDESKDKQVNIDLLDSMILNNLKVQLSQAEANFAELKQRLSKNHPDYKSASAELASLRWRFKKEMDNVQAQLKESANREEQRFAELNNKVEEQKLRLLTLNEDLQTHEVLSRDVEVAKQILSATMERMSQSAMEGQIDQADVAILNRAEPPTSHSKPKLLLNMIISLFLGIFLAIVFALLIELTTRMIRTKSDLEDSLGIPVLAEVSKIKPKKL